MGFLSLYQSLLINIAFTNLFAYFNDIILFFTYLCCCAAAVGSAIFHILDDFLIRLNVAVFFPNVLFGL